MKSLFLNIGVGVFLGACARYGFDAPMWAAFSLTLIITAQLETNTNIKELR